LTSSIKAGIHSVLIADQAVVVIIVRDARVKEDHVLVAPNLTRRADTSGSILRRPPRQRGQEFGLRRRPPASKASPTRSA